MVQRSKKTKNKNPKFPNRGNSKKTQSENAKTQTLGIVHFNALSDSPQQPAHLCIGHFESEQLQVPGGSWRLQKMLNTAAKPVSNGMQMVQRSKKTKNKNPKFPNRGNSKKTQSE